jgi:hypothetical protein
LVRKRIVDHLDNFDLLCDKQFGFVGGRSTTLQLLKVMDDWTEILDNGGVVEAVF